jgi:DNA polymerase III alpha subunit (gram-positive type)
VKPQKKIASHITELTGISQAQIDREADPLSVVLANFIDFIQDAPLVGFNAPFEMNFLYDAAVKNNVGIHESSIVCR